MRHVYKTLNLKLHHIYLPLFTLVQRNKKRVKYQDNESLTTFPSRPHPVFCTRPPPLSCVTSCDGREQCRCTWLGGSWRVECAWHDSRRPGGAQGEDCVPVTCTTNGAGTVDNGPFVACAPPSAGALQMSEDIPRDRHLQQQPRLQSHRQHQHQYHHQREWGRGLKQK